MLVIYLAGLAWLAVLASYALGYWCFAIWLAAFGLFKYQKVDNRTAALLAFASMTPAVLAINHLSLKLPDAWLQSAEHFRAVLAQTLHGLTSDSTALVLGLTVGDDSALSKTLQSQMRSLSLTHLTAVSGTNCSIVVLASFGIFSMLRLRRSLRIGACLAVLFAYLWLVGPEPSVLRAGLMAVVVLLAQLKGNRYAPREVLALAVCLGLALWPDLAASLGFSLSVFATLAVLELAPKLAERFSKWLPGWLALGLAVVLAAQVACLPILVWIQPEFSLFGVLANLLAEPVVALVTILGLVSVVLFPVMPWFSEFLFFAASMPTAYLVALVQWFGGLDASVATGLPILAFFFSLALLVAVVTWSFDLCGKRVASVSLVFMLSVIAIGQVQHQISGLRLITGDWFMIACDVGQGDATLLRSNGKVALIDVGPEPTATNRCLQRAGIGEIDLLVLTHYDLDHVGGLAGVLQAHRVESALVTEYRDDRPGAEIVGRLLDSHGVQANPVHLGNTGSLGAARFLVLNPERGGQDAEDANDGSIAMRWDFPQVEVLTLADLGEKGQMRLAANRSLWWLPEQRQKTLVMKVSHHGSADQYPEFLEWLKPRLATFSAGAGNPYGHPTQRTLDTLARAGTLNLRTDQLGSISISADASGVLSWNHAGR